MVLFGGNLVTFFLGTLSLSFDLGIISIVLLGLLCPSDLRKKKIFLLLEEEKGEDYLLSVLHVLFSQCAGSFFTINNFPFVAGIMFSRTMCTKRTKEMRWWQKDHKGGGPLRCASHPQSAKGKRGKTPSPGIPNALKNVCVCVCAPACN